MEEKKSFLYKSSLVYNNILKNTDNNCIRKFLAFKIVINTMSFEDLINNRTFTDLRQIRNVFLAHKQENDFFTAHNASDKINNENMERLLEFMKSNTQSKIEVFDFNELDEEITQKQLDKLSTDILNLFHKDYYSDFRISNNFLCTEKNQIKELSSNEISGVFYRFNSSKEIGILTNYFITNLSRFPQFKNTLINFKIDYFLHSVNMYDCIYKDQLNNFSINGLYEIMKNNNLEGVDHLKDLKYNESHLELYKEMRTLRNKLAGHMDKSESLSNLLMKIDDFDIARAYDFVNCLDKAVYDVGQKNFLIRNHYNTFNMKIDNLDIIGIEEGLANKDYFE